jgi:uncharacterized protein
VVDGLQYAAAAGAGVLAGGINAIAGGGTLISFPALQAIGLSSIDANVTNIVALTPGYLAGSYAQRADLDGQAAAVRRLGLVAGAGALVGSILLVEVAASTFKAVVPFLILVSCGALLAQGRLRLFLATRRAEREGPARDRPVEYVTLFLSSVYGGFFGAGLGIMLLAVLGLFSDDTWARLNARKQLLSLLISAVAATFLAFSGHVAWGLAGVMAVAGILGGFAGGRLVRVINPTVLRVVVVLFGIGVAIHYWV